MFTWKKQYELIFLPFRKDLFPIFVNWKARNNDKLVTTNSPSTQTLGSKKYLSRASWRNLWDLKQEMNGRTLG